MYAEISGAVQPVRNFFRGYSVNYQIKINVTPNTRRDIFGKYKINNLFRYLWGHTIRT